MSATTQTLLCRYHYDPLDRLAATASLGQPDALRFYQKNRLATEIQGAVQRSIVQHEDLLLAQQQRVDSTIEMTLLATDQQRSVLRLLDNPDTQSLTYDPYGHLPAESGLTSLLGFNGEHRDPVTGHYLLGNGYRAFNPVLMRFNSPDSLSPFEEGGINGYAYCAGDPVNLMDPTGRTPFWLFFNRFQKTLTPLKRLTSGPIPIQKSTAAVARAVNNTGRRAKPVSRQGMQSSAAPSSPDVAGSAEAGSKLLSSESWRVKRETLKAYKNVSGDIPKDAIEFELAQDSIVDGIVVSRALRDHHRELSTQSLDPARRRANELMFEKYAAEVAQREKVAHDFKRNVDAFNVSRVRKPN